MEMTEMKKDFVRKLMDDLQMDDLQRVIIENAMTFGPEIGTAFIAAGTGDALMASLLTNLEFVKRSASEESYQEHVDALVKRIREV